MGTSTSRVSRVFSECYHLRPDMTVVRILEKYASFWRYLLLTKESEEQGVIEVYKIPYRLWENKKLSIRNKKVQGHPDRNMLAVGETEIYFCTRSDYLVWYGWFVWYCASTRGRNGKTTIDEQKGHPLLVFNKIFAPAEWKKGVERCNLDPGALLPPGEEGSESEDEESHCMSREHINMQYYVSGNYQKKEIRQYLQRAPDGGLFHIHIFGEYFRYVKNQAEPEPKRRICKYPQNSKCLCFMYHEQTSTYAFKGTLTPEAHRSSRLDMLANLCKNPGYVEEYVEMYLKMYKNQLYTKINRFLEFLTRSPALLRDMRLFFRLDQVLVRGVQDLDESVLFKFAVDVFGIRVEKMQSQSKEEQSRSAESAKEKEAGKKEGSSFSDWRPLDEQKHIFSLRIQGIQYVLQFVPQPGTALIDVLQRLEQKIFQVYNISTPSMLMMMYNVLQLHVLAKSVIDLSYPGLLDLKNVPVPKTLQVSDFRKNLQDIFEVLTLGGTSYDPVLSYFATYVYSTYQYTHKDSSLTSGMHILLQHMEKEHMDSEAFATFLAAHRKSVLAVGKFSKSQQEMGANVFEGLGVGRNLLSEMNFVEYNTIQQMPKDLLDYYHACRDPSIRDRVLYFLLLNHSHMVYNTLWFPYLEHLLFPAPFDRLRMKAHMFFICSQYLNRYAVTFSIWKLKLTMDEISKIWKEPPQEIYAKGMKPLRVQVRKDTESIQRERGKKVVKKHAIRADACGFTVFAILCFVEESQVFRAHDVPKQKDLRSFLRAFKLVLDMYFAVEVHGSPQDREHLTSFLGPFLRKYLTVIKKTLSLVHVSVFMMEEGPEKKRAALKNRIVRGLMHTWFMSQLVLDPEPPEPETHNSPKSRFSIAEYMNDWVRYGTNPPHISKNPGLAHAIRKHYGLYPRNKEK